MRIRKKKWLDEELRDFERYIKDPKQYVGNWNTIFGNDYPIHLEIGIGKGDFISKLAKASYDKKLCINYIGIDVVDKMLGLAKRKIQNEYMYITDEEREQLASALNGIKRRYFKEMQMSKEDFESLIKLKEDIKNGNEIPNNIMFQGNLVDTTDLTYDELNEIYNDYLMFVESNLNKENKEIYAKIQESNLGIYFPNIAIARQDAENIDYIFDVTDRVERIYLNFSNPWPRDKHNKRRLTYPTKLAKYLSFLNYPKEIFFKTDDLNFFEDSLEYFKKLNFNTENLTYDLESNDIFESELPTEKNIVTEHEKMFIEDGKKIYAGIFKYAGKE